jgi:hypothetical protein
MIVRLFHIVSSSFHALMRWRSRDSAHATHAFHNIIVACIIVIAFIYLPPGIFCSAPSTQRFLLSVSIRCLSPSIFIFSSPARP